MALVDPRVKKHAKILVDYSVKVKKGENVMLVGHFASKPLILEVYKLLIKRGVGEVRTNLSSYDFSEAYFKNASDKQLQSFPKIAMYEMKNMDCYIGIGATENTRGLTGVDAKKISQRSLVTRKIQDYRVEKTRWVVTRFPNESQAQEADMSLSDYEDFVFRAVNGVDWRKKFKEQEKLRKLIDGTSEVHIVATGTDLRLNIKGRKAENASGHFNMPDGEVHTSVVENSANGFIEYSYPALQMGREYHDIRLEFKNGKVVKANASKGEEDLNKILDMDQGARFIGELGFGNNFKINRFIKDTLFDEKIGGSVHIALGFGYKKTLSKNSSALHWDMIKDLRKGHGTGKGGLASPKSLDEGGEIWFDDKLVQKDGGWVYS